jgi:hypothetical protein
MKTIFKNRYGDEYWYERRGKDVLEIVGDLKHWRFGGKEGVSGVDMDDLGFVDPSGGPYLTIGSDIHGYTVTKIWANEGGVFFGVTDD